MSDFDALKIMLASPDQIKEWSYGEVTKAETINYRTFKAEPDGLMCEKIFGPTKNYRCYCGKYKKIRYKGIVCDKCGVEITTKDVRRERMGHIDLAVPVTHVWFAHGVPNELSILLDVSYKKVLAVIYYSRYVVTELEKDKREEVVERITELKESLDVEIDQELDEKLKESKEDFNKEKKEVEKELKDEDKEKVQFEIDQLDHKYKKEMAALRHDYAEIQIEEESFYEKLINLTQKLQVGSLLTVDEYTDLEERDLLFFEAEMGAGAIESMLERIDLEKEIEVVDKRIKKSSGKKRLKHIRRLQYLEGLYENDIDPTWIILKRIPVLPPDLRPIIPLSGGKFATHDLNDLYRRIINRNNRLKELIEIGAPEIILRNEKRMLQESVDALIDNSHTPGKAVMNSRRLPYKSLTDQIRGKKGLFRKNLLGKRVDYSGRAVIVGDATLSMDQCGLPKAIAIEVFKPFVIHELLDKELAANVRIAKDMIDDREEIVWDMLQEVIEERPVLLNRAPTLHKYSIQAFYPVLVEGNAIHLHPLVCKAFNADFDGDQMAVHVVLTEEALKETKDKMMASKNIKSVANGKVLAKPSKDMLLGYFMLTDMQETEEKPKKLFGSFEDAIKAYHREKIAVDEPIMVRDREGKAQRTSVGRVIFNSSLPEDYEFVNERIGGPEITEIIERINDNYPKDFVVDWLDEMKTLGFKYATDLGFSFAMEDCGIEYDVKSEIEEMEDKDNKLQENYLQGLMTLDEKTKLSVNMWNDFADEVAEEVWNTLEKNNAVYEMVTSKANGGKIQARQILTVTGVVRDSAGKWIPLPIKGNFRDGLSAFEYFVAANGGRKGQADQSLRTPLAGYLTRRVVEVGHSVIIREEDCGYDDDGLEINRSDDRRLDYVDRIYGRVLAQDLEDAEGNKILEKDEVITKDKAEEIDKLEINRIYVRSPLYCKSPVGICRKCYGHDIEEGKLVEMGKAVGVIAAQSIGEPGTQLTMKTFHKGGVAKTDITQGLPRVEELLEARTPKSECEIASLNGKVTIEKAEDDSKTLLIIGHKDMKETYVVSEAKKVMCEDGDEVKLGETLFINSEEVEKQAPFDGKVIIDHGLLHVEGKVKAEETITVMPDVDLLVQDGDEVNSGQQLTAGAIDPDKLAKVASIEKAQKYIIDETQKVFNEQGVTLSDIHFEVIVRQMARLARVLDSGNSDYLIGSLVNRFVAETKNDLLREYAANIAWVVPRLVGIKKSGLRTESFLSSMSFQEQVRVLTRVALQGRIDYLRGMKENVIIGKLIPVGERARIEDPFELPEVKIKEALKTI